MGPPPRAGLGVLCAVDRPQFASDCVAVLPGGEQMHDASLYHSVWKDGVDRTTLFAALNVRNAPSSAATFT